MVLTDSVVPFPLSRRYTVFIIFEIQIRNNLACFILYGSSNMFVIKTVLLSYNVCCFSLYCIMIYILLNRLSEIKSYKCLSINNCTSRHCSACRNSNLVFAFIGKKCKLSLAP